MIAQPIDTDTFIEQLGLEPTAAMRDQVELLLREFNSRSGSGAIAAAIGARGQISIGYAEGASAAAASAQARQRCEQERSRLAEVVAQCEIVRLNAQPVARAAQLKAPYSASDPSFVWQVTTATATVYLAGTIHVMKPTLYPLNRALREAYALSDQIAVEVNLLEPRPDQAGQISALMRADPSAVAAAMSPMLRSRVRRFAEGIGRSEERLLAIQPSLLSANVAMVQLGALGYEPSSGIDRHFLQRAQVDRRPIIELESAVDQIALLTSIPLPVQAQMLEETFETIGEAGIFLEQTLAAWLGGDADGLFDLMMTDYESPDLADFGTAMFDERNTAMTAQIIDLLEGDRRTLVLVGAGHFGGPKGILRQLREAGYPPQQLERG